MDFPTSKNVVVSWPDTSMSVRAPVALAPADHVTVTVMLPVLAKLLQYQRSPSDVPWVAAMPAAWVHVFVPSDTDAVAYERAGYVTGLRAANVRSYRAW